MSFVRTSVRLSVCLHVCRLVGLRVCLSGSMILLRSVNFHHIRIISGLFVFVYVLFCFVVFCFGFFCLFFFFGGGVVLDFCCCLCLSTYPGFLTPVTPVRFFILFS